MVHKVTATKKSVASKNKIVVIQEIYGKSTGTAKLEDTAKYLKKAGFKSLADLLQPAK